MLLPCSETVQPPYRCIPHHWPCIQVPAHPVCHTGSMREKLFDPEIHQKQAQGLSLSQQHLEAFMLMATQPDVLKMLDCDKIIDGIAEKSKLLQKLLIE